MLFVLVLELFSANGYQPSMKIIEKNQFPRMSLLIHIIPDVSFKGTVRNLAGLGPHCYGPEEQEEEVNL